MKSTSSISRRGPTWSISWSRFWWSSRIWSATTCTHLTGARWSCSRTGTDVHSIVLKFMTLAIEWVTTRDTPDKESIKTDFWKRFRKCSWVCSGRALRKIISVLHFVLSLISRVKNQLAVNVLKISGGGGVVWNVARGLDCPIPTAENWCLGPELCYRRKFLLQATRLSAVAPWPVLRHLDG